MIYHSQLEKDIILKAESISKQYRLGQVGTGTLSHDINRWWHKIRGKENPYLKIGDTNDRSTKGNSDYVWALQDINFEVERGEVLGIIGKNGAGKSTLLKILSKVTAPTTGSIKSRGRIASLLEVGTGFNGEMTGRENIFLNGAILGMTKKEISSKLDEIIEFSGCERYIDTPVKSKKGVFKKTPFNILKLNPNSNKVNLFIQNFKSGIHAFKFRNNFLHFGYNIFIIIKISYAYKFINLDMQILILVLNFLSDHNFIVIRW